MAINRILSVPPIVVGCVALIATGCVGKVPRKSGPTDKFEAVRLAEAFVSENGYTSLPKEKLKKGIDFESIEWSSDRDEILASRFATLLPKAIGVKPGSRGYGDGWSVAFDFQPSRHTRPDLCRVVSIKPDGSEMRMEHVDGIRVKFAGFE